MAHYELNEEYNGIEIYFDAKPSEAVLNKLRGTFRWHNKKKCWFAKQNEQTMAITKELCGGEIAVTPIKEHTTVQSAKMPKCVMNERCCYASSFSDFKTISEGDFINKMKSAFSEEYALALGSEQIHAWKDCFKVLQELDLDPDVGIIFEYALPYESGRRPDVILLSDSKVLILEFKMKGTILEADVDQAAAYGRDIREYHFESRDKEVIPYLVLTRANGINENRIDVTCISGDVLESVNVENVIFVPAENNSIRDIINKIKINIRRYKERDKLTFAGWLYSLSEYKKIFSGTGLKRKYKIIAEKI